MIYVCIPSHNESTTLGPLLWKVARVMREFGREFTLVVLDDGSTDETRETLERYARRLPLEVLREATPVGYGAAVDRLLRHVAAASSYPKRDAAVVLQADLTDDPDALVDLVKALEGGADVVAAAAPAGAADVPGPRRWGRRLAPWVLGRGFREAPVPDPLNGLRAYRVIVLRKALREDDAPLARAREPWVASVELLHRVVGFSRRVEAVPLAPRYGLLARPSRFRPTPALKGLFALRGRRWAAPAQAAREDAA
ncbi:MAG: glycosyltransferase [Longimicrobiales bacterium]|nr:glycosyltransferase [Longimicrobiales bacterium]